MQSTQHFLLLLILVFAVNAEADDVDSLLDGLFVRLDAMLNYQEIRMVPKLAEPIIIYGGIQVAADGRLIKTVEKPFEERLEVANGSVVLERAGHVKRVPVSASAAIEGGYKIIHAVLVGDSEALRRMCELSIDADRDDWNLQCIPKLSETRRYIEKLSVSGVQNKIISLRVDQGLDRWSEFYFDKVEESVAH